MSTVKLSNGQTVHFIEKITRRAEKAYLGALMKGATVRMDDGEGVLENVAAENMLQIQDRMFPHIIDKIVDKEGHTTAFSEDWLEDLDQIDYLTLADHVNKMQAELKEKREQLEKKMGEHKGGSNSGVGGTSS